MNKVLLALLGVLFIGGAALAHTVTLNWAWPTTRDDGSALPLSEIGSITVYDTARPVPGLPGTAVQCDAGPMPPTVAMGSCETPTLPAGTHNFVARVDDNATPPNPGVVSMAVSVTVPLSGPSAVVLQATLN